MLRSSLYSNHGSIILVNVYVFQYRILFERHAPEARRTKHLKLNKHQFLLIYVGFRNIKHSKPLNKDISNHP